MPAKIPLQVLILTSLQHILPRSLAFLIRLLVTLTMWLLVMPLCTCWLYRLWLTRHPALAPNRSTLLYDVVSGLTIASVIALSFIVMVFLSYKTF